jgi:hypothetical protein
LHQLPQVEELQLPPTLRRASPPRRAGEFTGSLAQIQEGLRQLNINEEEVGRWLAPHHLTARPA